MTVDSVAKLPVKETLGSFALPPPPPPRCPPFFSSLLLFFFSFLFLSFLSLLYGFEQSIQLFIFLPRAVTLVIWTMSSS